MDDGAHGWVPVRVVNVAVVVIGVVLAAAAVVWFFVNRKNPEDAASHSPTDRGSEG